MKGLAKDSIYLFFICAITIIGINDCIAQEQMPSISLEIDRLVVKNGQGFNYQWEWEPYVASQWGLVKRTKRIPYYDMGNRNYITQEYWGWDGESITNETLSNGSIVTTSKNRYIQTSLNLHPEYLYVTFFNLTSYYIGVDLSTAMISISYPEDHPDWGTKRYEVAESMLSLSNTLGTPYHYIVIPPFKSLTSGYFIVLKVQNSYLQIFMIILDWISQFNLEYLEATRYYCINHH